MKRSFYAIVLGVLVLFSATSCNKSSEKKGEQTAQEAPKAEKFKYAYAKENTSVLWQAFKFTAKTGVGGKFDEFTVTPGTESSENPLEILKALTFTIPVNSVNSNVEDRDSKIKKYFFGEMSETESITGSIKSLTGDAKSGDAVVSIKMNAVEKDVTLKYAIDEDAIVRLTGVVNVDDFNAGGALSSLNKVCEELHKGTDGISKLWSEVEVTVKAGLTKTPL